MHYSETVYRPPYEANSILLQVTNGCSWNKCKFCGMYKQDRFHASPINEVEEDLQEWAEHKPASNRVYLVGANPFTLGFDRLKQLSGMIHRYLPQVTSIGGFCRITDITPKSDEQLTELHLLGYDQLFIGTESADDAVLDFMNKGFHVSDTIEQLRRLEQAGITYHINHMNGLAGAGKARTSALTLAELYNKLHPAAINLTNLTVVPGSVLYEEITVGNYKEPSELELLEEQKLFIENLTLSTVVNLYNVGNGLPFAATLPRDKKQLVSYMEYIISSRNQ